MRRAALTALVLLAGAGLAACTPGANPGVTATPAVGTIGTKTAPPTGAGTGTPARTQAPVPWQTPSDGDNLIIDWTVPAPSLATNKLGDPAERTVNVYLPPTYFDSDRRYPVVYFLEGFGAQIGEFHTVRWELARQMQAAAGREFIIVDADGSNSLGANFYANSSVDGNMADFVADDLVAATDATFRTIPEREARGLAGFSMGGAGAVNIALARADVFGSLYALSPPLFEPGSQLEGIGDDQATAEAYAAAFAPDPEATAPPWGRLLDPDLPFDQQDPTVVAAYERGFGNLPEKIADYLAKPDRLSHIRVSYGSQDVYPWIPSGCDYFVGLLQQADVPHSLRTFAGGHDVDADFIDHDFVGYFSSQFGAVA